MPELPEVEVIRCDLAEAIVGCTIQSVDAPDEMVLVDMSPRQFARRLAGRKILGVSRLGKVLLLELSGEVCLLVHLRMSGRIYPVPPDEPLPDHVRATFHLDDGRRLLFMNPRRLGRLEIADCKHLDEARLLRNMGIDALSDELDEQVVGEMLESHSIAIKQFLLDQSHIAGVGNIYASEVLHRCGLHPDTPANALDAQAVRKLLRTIRRVLNEAIKWRGTSFSGTGVGDYLTGRGVPGAFQKRLRVYGREGKTCRRRGCVGVIVRTTHSGRSSYYCPCCQPPPS